MTIILIDNLDSKHINCNTGTKTPMQRHFVHFVAIFCSHMLCYSMKYKKNYIAYLNLHLAVYLCYKMVNVRAIIKNSVLSHT